MKSSLSMNLFSDTKLKLKFFFITFILFFIKEDKWFKLRHASPSITGVLKALVFNKKTRTIDLSHEDQIVVLGIGPSALSFLGTLKRSGFKNVKIISKDSLFGGKCINYGCMPSAFSLTLGDVEPILRKEKIYDFVNSLRDDVESQFKDFGFQIIQGDASFVKGKFLYLTSGEKVLFDRLVIGTGAHYPAPSRVPLNSIKVIEIEKLWSLPVGTSLIIFSKDNVASTSIAEVAHSMGLRVTLLMSGQNPLKDLPSYKYYIRTLKKKGINIFDNIRLIRVDDEGVSFERGAVIDTLPYDSFLVTSKPVPNIPTIDSKNLNIHDVDLTHGCLSSRPDISLIGDSSGYFTASEAEYQSRMLINTWMFGTPIDLGSLIKMPIFLHGESTLAITGHIKSLYELPKSWKEIDFKVLGWSKVSRLDGKIWYLLNKNGVKIDAIQICHPMACELVPIASYLIDLPLTDPAWRYPFIHPSSTEIFKAIADLHCPEGL